jgi:uncharacterized protein
MSAENFTQEEGNKFIIECHSDLETVKRKVAEKPGLANAYNAQMIESALGAAGHIGRADIAEFLLAHGAKLELAAAAMLGRKEYVADAIKKDPKAAKSGGAHNIPIAFHAALSGDVEIIQMLWDAGAEEEVKGSLLGAVMKDRLPMARWLLEHGADTDVKSFDGKTPLELAESQGATEMTELLRNAK